MDKPQLKISQNVARRSASLNFYLEQIARVSAAQFYNNLFESPRDFRYKMAESLRDFRSPRYKPAGKGASSLSFVSARNSWNCLLAFMAASCAAAPCRKAWSIRA